MSYEMKPLFRERMKNLLSDERDFAEFEKIVHTSPRTFIRCNTLKIGISELLLKLRKKWVVSQPFPSNPEIMLVDSTLSPGELGNSIEHILGYYYIQEISSMLSPIALGAQPGEFVLDLCASPGSKSTQIASYMENTGTLIANDLKLDRIKILASNMERCGVLNMIVTKNDAISLCSKFSKEKWKFDRILLDAPCSGEGTLRSSPKTFIIWNKKVIDNLSRQQKKMIAFAFKCLKKGGTLVYSTCTHSPEENEGVVDFALKNFPVKIESISLPLKCRSGVLNWEGEDYSEGIEKCCRIYPQDNDSEGFFIAKMTLLEEVE